MPRNKIKQDFYFISLKNLFNFSKFYENNALISDPVDGPIFASLLGK
jgi:hypothetical protein